MRRIAVIGDAILDVYINYSRKTTRHGVPIVDRRDERELPGGASAVANMCKHLGANTTLLTSTAASRKVRHVVDGVQLFREDFDERGGQCHVSSLESILSRDDVVIISDYGKGAVTKEVVDAARDICTMVIVDPYFGECPTKYKSAWLCCPNWEAYRDRSVEWREMKRLCVKLDSRGALLVDGAASQLVPAIDVDVVDCCAAGDQWVASLAVCLAGGSCLHESVRLANIAAGIGCTKLGATPVTASEWKSAQLASL